jgi:hypothetical protein
MPSFGFFRKSQVIGHQFSLICPHSLHKCFIYQWELAVFGAKSQIWSDRDHHRPFWTILDHFGTNPDHFGLF